MFPKTFLSAVFLVMMTLFISAQTPPIEPGVSKKLAEWRAANYSDVRYKLNITLEKGAPLMRGTIEVAVKLNETGAKNDLILDWRTTQFQNNKEKPSAEVVAVNGTGAQASPLANAAFSSGVTKPENSNAASPFASQSERSLQAGTLALQSNEHLLIPQKYLKTGENVIVINFASPIKTSGAGVTRYVDKEDGAEYVYSLFVPSDASTAFPVFDQPDLKARFSLNVTAPNDWTVITNSLGETSEVVYSDPTKSREFISKFVETPPISSYVFAFAAGPFKRFNIPDQSTTKVGSEIKEAYKKWLNNDISISISSEDAARMEKEKLERLSKGFASNSKDFLHIYVRQSQAEKFKQHANEVFRLNREGVKFLESYFDYKFPFPKYDLVLIPEFPFGGMEHAGATFLRESSIIFPTDPTKNDFVSRANLIFHEAAHQWFGDTVTMKWFDDLWLKEGFAEFMAYKTLEKVLPEYNAWKIFYERNKQAAYLTDSTRGTTPIYQEIENLSAAKSAYGNIVYRKAPSFLKQAEFYLGEDKFQLAVRAFLKKHEFANASWQDLVKEFETASKQDLKDWSKDWVTKRGMFVVSYGNYQVNVFGFTGRPIIELKAKHTLEDKTVNPRMKVKVLANSKNGSVEVYDLSLKSKVENLALKREHHDFIFPNYQDYGYSIFLLDAKSRAYVLENIQNEKDDFLRTMMWGSLWDSVREGELDPKNYVELVIKNINVETDESTIQTLLGRTSTAMNYYLSDKQREEFAPQIETLLIEKMRNAATVGQRITFYRAFLNIAASEKARTILKQFDDSKLDIIQTKDFRLKTKDKFDIVTRLLVLSDKDAPALLAELERTETSDEAKRYAYAAKAAVATSENKSKFWNDFVANKDISESWIEAAFAPFNSPKHSDLTLPYLEKALAELPNLKRNRKIFFVNGWLAAFIGGQRSEKALKIVNDFLDKNPNLDKDLRLKILENSDAIERAVKIRGKFKAAAR